MVNFQNLDFFPIFLYIFTKNCVATGTRKMPIEYMFCFFCSEQCIKIISSGKTCGLFSSIFKTIIPNNTTLLSEKKVGQLNPSHFGDGLSHSHCIALTIKKIIDFCSQGIFTFLCFYQNSFQQTKSYTPQTRAKRSALSQQVTPSKWFLLCYI